MIKIFVRKAYIIYKTPYIWAPVFSLALSLYFRHNWLISASRFHQTVSHFRVFAFAIFIAWKSYIHWTFLPESTLHGKWFQVLETQQWKRYSQLMPTYDLESLLPGKLCAHLASSVLLALGHVPWLISHSFETWYIQLGCISVIVLTKKLLI